MESAFAAEFLEHVLMRYWLSIVRYWMKVEEAAEHNILLISAEI